MAEPGKASWPTTPDGNIGWEMVFEATETGLIPRVLRSKTPLALRKNTIAVVTKLYASGSTPDYVSDFTAELNSVLPDDLGNDEMIRVSETISTLLRRIKAERIAQIHEVAHLRKLSEERNTKRPKPSKSTSGDRPKGRSRKTPRSRGAVQLTFLICTGMLLLAAGGFGGWWWYTDPARNLPPTRTQQLIEEMRAAARGEGPDRHVFGWALHTKIKAGLIGVTAIGIPADACASAAWVFVNRGNVVINDIMPEKISPQILRQACALKGQRASLTWLQRVEDVDKNNK